MTEPISPDLVNAIVRNPDDPRYPSQITVFCDHCGVENTGDYIVSADMTREERLGVARQHLVANEGWEHTADGDDFCPVHAGSPAEEPAAVVSLTEEQLDAIEARANAATPGPWTVSEDYSDVITPDGGQLASYWNPTSETRNGEFIAAARTDVPALLRHIKAQEITIAELRAPMEATHAIG